MTPYNSRMGVRSNYRPEEGRGSELIPTSAGRDYMLISSKPPGDAA